MPTVTKKARLEARITDDQKAFFRRAAALEGRTLTEFVVNSAQEAANRTIRDHDNMRLSRIDSEIFMAALLSDAEPERRLQQAAQRYKKLIGK